MHMFLILGLRPHAAILSPQENKLTLPSMSLGVQSSHKTNEKIVVSLIQNQIKSQYFKILQKMPIPSKIMIRIRDYGTVSVMIGCNTFWQHPNWCNMPISSSSVWYILEIELLLLWNLDFSIHVLNL